MTTRSGAGGGTGLFGQGCNGAGGTAAHFDGFPGSGGCNSKYGGGAGGVGNGYSGSPLPGTNGAVRIVWPGCSRLFPSTNVGTP